MPSRQVISPDIWAGLASPEVRMAHAYLRPIADHHGRFRWDPGEIANWTGLEERAVSYYLDECWRNGLVQRYRVDGQEFGEWVSGSGLSPSQRARSRFPAPTKATLLSTEPRKAGWRAQVTDLLAQVAEVQPKSVEALQFLVATRGAGEVLETLAFAYQRRPRLALDSFVARYGGWRKVLSREVRHAEGRDGGADGA